MAGNFIELRKFCMFACACLVLVYLALLCYVNPGPELIFAIAVELFSFAGFLYFRYRRSKSAAGRAGEAVISALKDQYALIGKWAGYLETGKTVFWLAAALALSIDCFAFCAAFAGARSLSRAVYLAVPMSASLGLHPAASLEVLAGAYVEAHKYEQAMPLYEEVLGLRLATFGKVHKDIAALYCDFGDLYTHQKQLARAEACYRMALQITTAILGDKGSGRAYTRLADCLRDEGRYQEAEVQYQIAYDMRARQFGQNSEKVAETLGDWAKMLERQGKNEQAAVMLSRVRAIGNGHREPSPLWSALASILLFVFSLYISNCLFGRKGVLTELATSKIKASVDAVLLPEGLTPAGQMLTQGAPRAQARNRLGRLVTLYRFQRKYEEADKYSALLANLGSD